MASSSALTKTTVAALMLVLFAGHLLLAPTPAVAAAAADGLIGRRSLQQGPSPSLSPPSVDDFINQCGEPCTIVCFRECFEHCVGFPKANFEVCRSGCLVYPCKKINN